MPEVHHCQVSILYGGGFYQFKHIKYAANVYVDVYMLIEAIDDYEFIKKFHIYNNLSEKEEKKKAPLKFMDVKDHLNGWGRIIYYTMANEGGE